MTSLSILVIVIFCIPWNSVYGAQCPYKECKCGQQVIMCNDLQLTSIPNLAFKNNTYFTVLQFDRNNITAVTSGSLPGNLTELSFIYNPLTTIEDDAFDGSSNTLTTLSVSKAKFIKLPDAFAHLNTLQYLTISECVIQDWNPDVMKHIGANVGTILLENMPVHVWPSWLQYFTNLTDLAISGCGIADIPDGSLDHLANIMIYLTLDNNSLTFIPKPISVLTSLQSLALDKNKIADVKWLPQSSKLKSLDLNNNKLHDSIQLSTLLRVYADTLSDFTIHSNLLTSFPYLDFLVHVQSLEFNHNHLLDPNSGSLPSGLSDLKLGSNALPRIPRFLTGLLSVTQLLLGSNSITDLEGTAFPQFTRGVELENNLITALKDTSFPINSSITYILFKNNPLASISDHAFVNLPHLVELNLQNTKLTRLPLALSFLGKIDVFDITNTESLVCTCLEKSLHDWIVNLPADRVKGTCGRSSVYNFYHDLSSDCPNDLVVNK